MIDVIVFLRNFKLSLELLESLMKVGHFSDSCLDKLEFDLCIITIGECDFFGEMIINDDMEFVFLIGIVLSVIKSGNFIGK